MWEDGGNPILVYSQAGIPPGASALSPDGRFIAFHADSPVRPEQDIFVIRVNGSGLIQLTDGSRNGHFSSNLNPSWSPDGTKIAFTNGADILFVDADGENMVRVTHDSNDNDNPDWSPDGRRIAFSTNIDGNYNIHTISIGSYWFVKTKKVNKKTEYTVYIWASTKERLKQFFLELPLSLVVRLIKSARKHPKRID